MIIERKEKIILRTQIFEGGPPTATNKFSEQVIFIPSQLMEHIEKIKSEGYEYN